MVNIWKQNIKCVSLNRRKIHMTMLTFFTDLDDIKEFAKSFKLRRLSMGLTQTQVGQALNITEGPAYSQSAICRLFF